MNWYAVALRCDLVIVVGGLLVASGRLIVVVEARVEWLQ